MPLPLVLITGASGYIGSHVVYQALKAGYPVRITVRPAKMDAMREQYGDTAEVCSIEDVATSDYTSAMKGVGAVIHIAAPLGKTDGAGVEVLLNSAIDGALNLLRYAATAGVRKVIITSTWLTTTDFDKTSLFFTDHTFTANDWCPATKEQAMDSKRTLQWVYVAAKAIGEREIWKFAEDHPEVDITTINPPMVYGPLPPGFKLGKDAVLSHSTYAYFYKAVLPQGGGKLLPVQTGYIEPPLTVDVRDVAEAHILALQAPPSSEVGQKRLLVAGPNWSWKDAVEHLAIVRPELKGRLADSSEAVKTPIATIDTSRARELLGMTTYIDWTKTVEDMTDDLIALEKSWDN